MTKRRRIIKQSNYMPDIREGGYFIVKDTDIRCYLAVTECFPRQTQNLKGINNSEYDRMFQKQSHK